MKKVKKGIKHTVDDAHRQIERERLLVRENI